MLNNYPGQQLLRGIAVGDLLNLPTLAIHVYGHVKAVGKAMSAPKELDTKPEFVAVAAEVSHLFEDLSGVIPGEWDDSAAARFKSLVLSDEGSDFLFSMWRWWNDLPTPPTPQEVGQKMTELAGQLVNPE